MVMSQQDHDDFWSQEIATGPLTPTEVQSLIIKGNQPIMTMTDNYAPPEVYIDPNQETFDSMPEPAPTPTAPAVVPTRRKLTITFSRTIQAQQYEPSTVAATMEAELPEHCTLEQAIAVYEAEMKLVKVAVLSQLDLPFKETPGNEAIIMEVFGEARVVSSMPATIPAPSPGLPAPGNPGFAPAAAAPPATGTVFRTKTPAPADLPYWTQLAAELSAGNIQSFWDNREGKTNPNSPDFKVKSARDATPEEKKAAKALWLNTCPDQFCELFGVVI